MKYIYPIFLLFTFGCKPALNTDHSSDNKREFDDFIYQLEKEYIYKSNKQPIIDCIKDKYDTYIDTITKPYFKVLYYEAILNELHDSHISLNTNTDQSYRLRSPIYLIESNNKFIIKNIFSSQLQTQLETNLIGATIESFNGMAFNNVLSAFPSKCMNKNNSKTREWIANKIVAGKRDQPRLLTLRLKDNKQFKIDLDTLDIKKNNTNLDSHLINEVGYIRINNTLGNEALVSEFDQTLDKMMDTKALIIDLRNTPNGGNTEVAEPIMGRLITKKKGYQICENRDERYTKSIMPRKMTYTKPIYVLVGRWTGGMGEGLAIGLDGTQRATIVGTEMNRLAGGIKTIKLLNSNFSFHIPFEKLYHLNGTLRETFVPNDYVHQTSSIEDHHLTYAMKLINN